MNEDGTIRNCTTKLLLLNVWVFHDYLSSLISNRNLLYISEIWKKLCRIFNIFANLFAFFYLEINGWTEMEYQEMEEIFHNFMKYWQDDLVDKFPKVIFVPNNSNLVAIRLSLHFALRDLYLPISLEVINLSNTTTHRMINKKKIVDISESMQSI